MRTAIRLVAGLSALVWAVLGFGVIDLWVTIAPGFEWLPVALLEAGWGLFATVFIAAGFALVAVHPEWTVEISLQLVGLAALIAVSAALSSEPAVWWMLLALVLPAALLAALAASRRPRGAGMVVEKPQSYGRWAAWPLAGLAAVGAVPWLTYAVDMYAANREGRPPEEITNGVNHWPIQGAFAVALVLFTLLAALRPALRRFNAIRAGIGAAYLGVCSLRFPDVAAALPTVWAVLAVVWGAAVVAVCLPLRREALSSPSAPVSSTLD